MEKGIQKDNFTSKYLTFLKRNRQIEEISGGGTPIQTIDFSNSPYIEKFSLPSTKEKFDYEKAKPVLMEIGATEVNELGYMIVSIPLKKNRWMKRQSTEYKIIKKTAVNSPRNKILNSRPSNHRIIYDKANQSLKMIGKNCINSEGIVGETDWILKREIKKTNRLGKADCGDFLLRNPIFSKKTEEKRINIKNVPVIITYDGRIICIPTRHEPSNIAAVGKRGTGKTLLLHRIIDEKKWLLKEKIMIMDDIQEECLSWNNPLKNKMWINQLRRIKENPYPLPIVYVYPHTNTLKLKYEKLKKEINFIEITVPFEEVIENAGIYLKLEEKGTLRYIWGIKRKLLECENPEEVRELIEEEFSGKILRGMRNKMLVSFENVFSEEILSITNPQYPFKIKETLKEIEGNPFVILAKIGLIPCFETNDLFSKRYMEEVLSYHLNSIFNSKNEGGLLENETVYILFDELTQICDDNNKNQVYESLCSLATRGRKKKIGILYATQNYSKIPRKIKSNTEYVFAFKHSNKEEVNQIKRDFDLRQIDEEEIMNLDDFEVVGITNQNFVFHDGSLCEEKVVKGKLIPPRSDHYYPK